MFADLAFSFGDIPTWVYVVGGIFAFIAITGKSVEMDFEAKVRDADGDVKGEVEIKKYKKESVHCEVSLYNVTNISFPMSLTVKVDDRSVATLEYSSAEAARLVSSNSKVQVRSFEKHGAKRSCAKFSLDTEVSVSENSKAYLLVNNDDYASGFFERD